MNKDLTLAGKSPRRELQLQGPRPPPLSLHKDSHKIRKPPVAPANCHHQPPYPPPRKPVIIYAVSPKVIHVNPNEFMALVQRLTGSSAPRVGRPDPLVNSTESVSPAARYATIEKANKSRVGVNIGDADVADEIRRVGSRTGLMPPRNDLLALVQRLTDSSVNPRVDNPDPIFYTDRVENAGKSRVINNISDDVANEFRRVGSRTGLVPPRDDFMALVQKFTDSSSTPRVNHHNPLYNTDGAVSVENVGKFGVTNNIGDDVSAFRRVGSITGSMPPRILLPSHENIGDDVEDEFRRVGSRTGSVPVGILSSGPDSLRPVSATFFSPLSNGNPLSFVHDFISPAGFYNTGLNYSELSSLLQSPTPFVSPRMVSPIPSMDLFNNFFDM